MQEKTFQRPRLCPRSRWEVTALPDPLADGRGWLLPPRNPIPAFGLSGLGLRPFGSRCWPPVHFSQFTPRQSVSGWIKLVVKRRLWRHLCSCITAESWSRAWSPSPAAAADDEDARGIRRTRAADTGSCDMSAHTHTHSDSQWLCRCFPVSRCNARSPATSQAPDTDVITTSPAAAASSHYWHWWQTYRDRQTSQHHHKVPQDESISTHQPSSTLEASLFSV